MKKGFLYGISTLSVTMSYVPDIIPTPIVAVVVPSTVKFIKIFLKEEKICYKNGILQFVLGSVNSQKSHWKVRIYVRNFRGFSQNREIKFRENQGIFQPRN